MKAALRRSTVQLALVDLAVGGQQRAQTAARRLNERGDEAWLAVAETALRWGVLATIEPYLREAPLSSEVRERLRARSGVVVARSMLILRSATDVFSIFAAAGIDAMAIKGVAVIAVLGRSVATRALGDLDVVVREADAGAARAALRAAGFDELDHPFERHMFDIANARRLHNFARTFVRSGVEIDLHFRFGPNPPDAMRAEQLIGRAVHAPVGGVLVRASNPLDGVLINTHHALRGSFAPQNTVRDLLDLRSWWTGGGLDARTDELCAVATRSGLASSLLALWSVSASRGADEPFAGARRALANALGREGRREALRLERYFEDTLRDGMPANFTLDAFAPRLYARSVLAMSRRREPEVDSALAARKPLAGRLLRAVPRCWRVVRELSRVRRLAGYRAVARAQSRYH